MTQITKVNLQIKSIFHIVTEQIIPSLLVSKNNEMTKINEMLMLDQNLHKNHSFSTSFGLHLIIEQNTIKIGIKVEVLHVTTLTARPIHKIDTVFHPEIDLVKTKVLLLHNTLDHDMSLTNAIHTLTVHHTDLLIDRLIDTILALDTDHAPIP